MTIYNYVELWRDLQMIKGYVMGAWVAAVTILVVITIFLIDAYYDEDE